MELNKQIVEILLKLKYTISTAESVTGGKLISTLIEVPGASKITEQSFIVYSDAAKMKSLGLDRSLIDRFGVVSEEVALEMARRTKAITRSNVVISTTGEAGPIVNEQGITVGTICYGLIIDDIEYVSTKTFNGDRIYIINSVVMHILNDLLMKLT